MIENKGRKWLAIALSRREIRESLKMPKNLVQFGKGLDHPFIVLEIITVIKWTTLTAWLKIDDFVKPH